MLRNNLMRTNNRAPTKSADTPVTVPTMAMMVEPLLDLSLETASEDIFDPERYEAVKCVTAWAGANAK